MNDPTRVVVDIADAELADGVSNLDSDNALISRVEFHKFADETGQIIRVTFYINGDVEHQLVTEGAVVKLSLRGVATSDDPVGDALPTDDPMGEFLPSVDPMGDALPDVLPEAEDQPPEPEIKLSGPKQLPTGTSLTSLDFEQTPTHSRVLIGTQGMGSFDASQPRGDTILVDIPGAFVPKSLSRVLDTSRFYTPVKMIRAYRTSRGARVAIQLREASEYEIERTPSGFVVLSVAIPDSMRQEESQARQDAASVSPEGPDEGIGNAYQNEILIGEQGRTVDPQVAFGSGGGSNDPASMLGMATGFMYDNSSATSGNFTGRKISLDFVNADIHSIFRLISNVSRLNIVTGDDVQGKISVRLENVPWDQALAAVLQAKGLASQRFGNIIRVAPIDTIKAEQQSALEAKRAQEELAELQLLILPLNYVKANDLENQLKELISARGTLQVDENSNQIIIKETEQRLAQIRELVRQLDKETPQVLIEARVVEASSAFSKRLGIQWGAALHANAATGYPTGLFFPNSVGVSGAAGDSGKFYSADATGSDSLLVDLGAGGDFSGVAFSLGSIPGLVNLDARLSAMEIDGWGKVVSEPRITTLDNKEARISQGARVPYLSTSSGGTQVQFVEAALEMSVTPHITNDSQIFLALDVTNNRADFSKLVQGQPAIQIKEASTSVLVADGDTTVIGGVFSSETAFSQSRVPGFHRIPLLGYMFKNASDEISRNELLVFVTPHVVTRAAVSSSSQ
jgi:type IV pilus assembly protein PilQ